MKRIQCPCCNNFTIESNDEIVVDICDVCFWQFDAVAHAMPDKIIGANSNRYDMDEYTDTGK